MKNSIKYTIRCTLTDDDIEDMYQIYKQREVIMKSRICIITETMPECEYLLQVDNQQFAIIGWWAADYFEKHYKSCGYQVIREDYTGDKNEWIKAWETTKR